MQEIFKIFKDIKSGALPTSEIPGFAFWMVRKSYRRFMFVMLILAVILWVREKAQR